MIAIVHGPLGCGKSTALRRWLRRRDWMPPRGFRTYFDGGTLRLAPWRDGAPSCEIMEKSAISCDFPPSSRPCPSHPWDPAYGPALETFLDSVFLGASPSSALQVQPPSLPDHFSEKCGPGWGEHSVRAGWKSGTARSESSPHQAGKQNNGCIVFETALSLPPPFPSWTFDAPTYWRSALATLDGDPSRPLVIDELGLFETLPGALDLTALRRLLTAIHTAPRAILVVQDRALAFWLKSLPSCPCTIRW